MKPSRRVSKLDEFKGQIIAWLEGPGLSARQIYERLKEAGFTGGYSIVGAFVRQVRPKPQRAYLTLEFKPAEAAQVDWGMAGMIPIGSTQRRLSFLVVVLCHSRLMYVEFFPSESMEMFLAGQQRAFEFFGGVPSKVILDNLKVGVLSHHQYDAPVFHPRYLEFAAHYGFSPVACNVKAPHEKGRVENGVGYIKGNFLKGLSLTSVAAVNEAARHWMDQTANVRKHGQTREIPREVFEKIEKPALGQLPPLPYEGGILSMARVSRRCRVTLDTNHYSVPAAYAGMIVEIKRYPQRLCIYYNSHLIATHVRSFERHQDYEQADHLQSIKEQRPRGRQQRLLADFLTLGKAADAFYQGLSLRNLNPTAHLRKILSLVELYGNESVSRALEDALEYQAFNSDYIQHILSARQRIDSPPGPLHLTRRSDLLDLVIPDADINIYDPTTPSSL